MGIEFIAIVLIIVVLLQAAQVSWLTYSLKQLHIQLDELNEILVLAAQGKVKLKAESDDMEGY